MRKVNSSQVTPFEEVERPNTPYTFVDGFGNDITVTEMTPDAHSPHDYAIMNDPLVYNNIGYAVRTANETRLGKSDDSGVVKVFKKDGLFDEIDHPGKEHLQNTSVVVAVKYGMNGKNDVVTYYDKPKGAVW